MSLDGRGKVTLEGEILDLFEAERQCSFQVQISGRLLTPSCLELDKHCSLHGRNFINHIPALQSLHFFSVDQEKQVLH